MAEAASWLAAQTITEAIDGPEEVRTQETTREPVQTWRCYIDASWTAKEANTGLAFVLYRGQECTLQGLKGTKGIKTPLQAELSGLLWAMENLVKRRILEVHFFTDCKQMSHIIEKQEEWPALALELDDLEFYESQFVEFSISFIPRSDNIRADNLSKVSRARDKQFTFVTTDPEALLALEANSLAFSE